MKFWLILLCVVNAFAGQGIGPARAVWSTQNEIVFKTPLSLRSQSLFQLRTSGTSVNLKFKKSESGRVWLTVPPLTSSELQSLLRADLQLMVFSEDGKKIEQTSLQWAGVLDELYADDRVPLGLRWSSTGGELSLWAPTARTVEILLYRAATTPQDQPDQVVPMTYQNGFWQGSIDRTWKDHWYLYRIYLFDPRSGQFRWNYVTDPYSLSLSLNSQKSQLVDLSETPFRPHKWQAFKKPQLEDFKNIVIYETHLRDLTANDTSLPAALRGTYLAFSNPNSQASRKLKSLAEAGLTHIHFLPLADFASVPEERNRWPELPVKPGLWLDSILPQGELERVRFQDSYNWGYDPVHWLSPEGSYAVNAENRVKELRQMVMDLNHLGLRVIVDVVFNHTYANESYAFSVLDLIVPNYYYRYNQEGEVQQSSCCPDTASEHRMMERLMMDAVIFWAKTYKVDGFRFDLMSFHSTDTMRKIKQRLEDLTLNEDGVDGKNIYIYGEAWEFGSLVEKAPAQAMTQKNSYGLRIGTFNDRMRDALRGGTTDTKEKSDQGFLTGLFYDFNHEPANRNTPLDLGVQREKLYQLQDVIKVGLAGNLRDFSLINYRGQAVKGSEVDFRGSSTGYAASTEETINYVSAHDGYSLWDAIQAKAPFYTSGRQPPLCPISEKVRMQWMALATVMLSQGVAFIEGGSEMLRSKSGDMDSYDSGDWFNALDLSETSNNWGVGLPPSWKNRNDWSFWSPRLQDPLMQVGSHDIQETQNYFKALLQLRKRMQNWRYSTAVELILNLEFLVNGKDSQPGLIAYTLKNDDGKKLIIFNTHPEGVVFENAILQSHNWKVAPELLSADPRLLHVKVRKSNQLYIPGRSTVVMEPAE